MVSVTHGQCDARPIVARATRNTYARDQPNLWGQCRRIWAGNNRVSWRN